MGSFQIVYDDFSGGQYMGNKSTNLPKNTFDGFNAMSNAYGQLMAGGTPIVAYTQTAVASSTKAQIMDQWLLGENLYAFCQWYASSSWTAKMVSFNVANGTVFPSPTVTTTNLTGQLGGKIAYDNASTKFFYVRVDGANAGYIRSVTTAGVDASVSTTLGGTGITDLVSYGYRTVAWGSTSKRVYYSNTDLTTWSTSQYYEFTGEVLNVLARSNDLLVVCTTGVFSLVGVLGSSVTIQAILPGANMPEGMRDAIIVGRNAIFADNSLSGNLDGRVHEMVGSSIRPIATLGFAQIQTVGAIGGYQQVRCFNTQDSGVVVLLKDGLSMYVKKQDGTWAYFSNLDFAVNISLERSEQNQMHVARPGVSSQNEYFVAAYVNKSDSYNIAFIRTIYNVTDTTYGDHDFRTTTTASGETLEPEGFADLPEYWHQKPFTVKHVIVEWTGRTNANLSVYVKPSGVVDTSAANVDPQEQTYLNTTLDPGGSGTFVTERVYFDTALKGYGAQVKLWLTDCRVKRVILMCED